MIKTGQTFDMLVLMDGAVPVDMVWTGNQLECQRRIHDTTKTNPTTHIEKWTYYREETGDVLVKKEKNEI